MEPVDYIDGLMQDCSISSVLAMEILQSHTKPLIFNTTSFMLSARYFMNDNKILVIYPLLNLIEIADYKVMASCLDSFKFDSSLKYICLKVFVRQSEMISEIRR